MDTFHITLQEKLGPNFAPWFSELTMTPLANGQTLLAGPISDQAALRGLLEQLWNLNLTIISIERIKNEPQNSSAPV
jgi:hypothetical protein